MLGLSLTILVSGFFSWFILKNSYKNRTLFNFNLIVLMAWYLPVLISLIFPFDHFGIKSFTYPVTFIALSMINIVLFASVLANKKFKRRLRVIKQQNIDFQSFSNKNIKRKSKSYHTFIYLIIAYIACLLELIKKLERGFYFSLDTIDENRLISLEVQETDIYSLIGAFTSGFIYYLLFFSISLETTGQKDDKTKILINWLYLSPYILYSIMVFLSGKKSPILYGLLIISLKVICYFKIKLNKIIVIALIALVVTTIFTTFQNQLRTASLDSYKAQKEIMKLRVKTDKSNPFLKYIEDSSPFVYSSLSTLYLYFGVQYDMLYATMSIDRNDYFIPPGFISFQAVYRFFSLILEWDYKQAYSQSYSFEQLVSQKYNAMSNVWGTFFSILYMEGGGVFLLLFIPICFTLNYYYTYKYLSKGSESDQFALLVVYMTFIVFFMNTPFRNPAFISMILATLFANPLNYFCKSILRKKTIYKIYSKI